MNSPRPEEAILDAALAKPRAERNAFIEQACANDVQLLQLVKALLRAHGGPGNCSPKTTDSSARLASIATALMGAKSANGSNSHKPPQQNAGNDGKLDVLPSVSGYEVISELGRGGMGVVYLARQTTPVRRQVALKVIKLGMDTRQVLGRFEAEKQVLALMDHPGIAKILDGGVCGTGGPYFVVELVRGPRITDYCDQHHQSIQERLRLFLQVCHAIQHAHQKGIIHRDIKPSNILVAQQDGSPVPKVIDFGIAKAVGGQPLTDTTVFTSADQFLGTPAYMSPEQAEPGAVDVDTRSDIYSLGVLLYELLTGTTPFDFTKLFVSPEEMRRRIRQADPARPSARVSTMAAEKLRTVARHRRTEPHKLIRAISGDLDWMVMKCLDKEQDRRYQTANSLAQDLERLLNNEPVVARPPSKLYQAKKFVRRNKLAVLAGASVFAGLVFGLGIATWSFIHEKEAREKAVAAQEQAQLAEAKSVAREREAREAERRAKTALSYFTDTQITHKFPPSPARLQRMISEAARAAAGPTNAISEKLAANALNPGLTPGLAIEESGTNAPAQHVTVMSPSEGATYTQLEAQWWQWQMQMPLTNSFGAVHPNVDGPIFDVTESQSGSVWFMAAPFFTVRRSCVIPPDKWLFVGLLNAEASNLEEWPFFGTTSVEQAAAARWVTAHIVSLFCELDGVPVPDLSSYHFTSPQIPINAPTPWIYGEIGGTGTSTGDGYFVMFEPLEVGPHVLHYGGAFQFRTPVDPFDLNVPMDMTYYISVQ